MKCTDNIKFFIRQYINEIIVFIFSFLLLSLLLNYIIKFYIPSNDDISLIVNSTEFFKTFNPIHWFTEGYVDYFRVYPEWSLHSKEIIRPVSNLIFYLNSLVFGKSFNYYLYFNFFVHSLGVSIVFYICNKYFKINKLISYLASFTFLFTPAVTNKFYFYYSSFVFDAFVSIIIFVSFVLAIKKKSTFAFIVTFMALLTKETSLLIPFAVAITLYVLKKNGLVKYLVFALIVIFIWFIYKKIVGVDISAEIIGGNISLWKIYGANIINGGLIWLSGIPDGNLIRESSTFIIILFIAFQFFFSISLCIDYYIEFKNKNNEFVLISFWAIALIVLLLFFGLSGRFGYTLHLFLVPMIYYLLLKSKSLIRRFSFFVFCSLIIISGIIFFSNILSSKEIANYKSKMQSASQLTELLKIKSSYPEVILINDFTASFGTPFLSTFAESNSKIIKINSLVNYDFWEKEKNLKSEFLINRYSDTVIVQVIIPDYTDFLFEGIKPEIFNHEVKSFFNRNEFINICFPEEEISGVSKLSGFKKYNFGKEMNVRIIGKTIPIIIFNPSIGKYEFINY